MRTINSLYFNQQWSVVMERKGVTCISSIKAANTNTQYKIQDFTKDACICISFSLQNEKQTNIHLKCETLLKMMEFFISRLSRDIIKKYFINLIKKDFYFKTKNVKDITEKLFDYMNLNYNIEEDKLTLEVEFVSLIYLEKGLYENTFKAYHLITGEDLNKKINYDIMNEFFENDVCLQIEYNKIYSTIYMTKKSFNQYLLYKFSSSNDKDEYHLLMDESIDNDNLFNYYENKKIEKILKQKKAKIYFNEIFASRFVLEKDLR